MFKLNRIFKEQSQLKSLVRESEQLKVLQQAWSNAAPQFKQMSHVVTTEAGLLTIAAYSGMVASAIKLQQSALLNKINILLQSQANTKSYNFNAIVVKVQVKTKPIAKNKRIAPLSANATHYLEQFARTTSNPALQAALQKLTKKH